MKPKIGEKYIHHKNPDKQYEIVCLAKDKRTRADLVVYRCLYPVNDLGEEFARDPIFVRTLEDFTEMMPDGRRRFEKV